MFEIIPKITFGMIVLNAEPFILYNLRALYPFAHQIIVVEGAAYAATQIATEDGHSSDSTLETIHHFQKQEDRENKILLVTAEDEGHPNGFWPGEKDEQSRAYAKRATGDYLWQVDSDEFYSAESMEKIIALLQSDPDISTVSFKMITFWGGLDYFTDGWYLRRGAQYYHRLFKWGKGYSYITHRPPTVTDSEGRDSRTKKWISGQELEKEGIFLHHYSLLLPQQVKDKCSYYNEAPWANRNQALEWYENNYLLLKNPFRVHNVYEYPSWLERFKGEHPQQVQNMINDIKNGNLLFQMRQTEDIEKLLNSFSHRMQVYLIKNIEPWDKLFRRIYWKFKSIIKKILFSFYVCK